MRAKSVLKAEDGLEALLALDREKNIDAVLSDVLMPRMDGYEQVALDFGADRFITKPALPKLLSRRVQKAIGNYEPVFGAFAR